MTGSPLVLVLEDETMIAMMVEDELVDAGYAVAWPFPTCCRALSWLSTNRPEFAVLDTHLQDGSCQDVALELRRLGIPFVMYSGAIDTDKAEFAGAPWVTKPAPGNAIIAALKKANVKAHPSIENLLAFSGEAA